MPVWIALVIAQMLLADGAKSVLLARSVRLLALLVVFTVFEFFPTVAVPSSEGDSVSGPGVKLTHLIFSLSQPLVGSALACNYLQLYAFPFLRTLSFLVVMRRHPPAPTFRIAAAASAREQRGILLPG